MSYYFEKNSPIIQKHNLIHEHKVPLILKKSSFFILDKEKLFILDFYILFIDFLGKE